MRTLSTIVLLTTLLAMLSGSVEMLWRKAPRSITGVPASGYAIRVDRPGHHIVLASGSPYQRGYHAAKLMDDVLQPQENTLLETLRDFFPKAWQAFVIQRLSMLYLINLEAHLLDDELDEIWGAVQGSQDLNPFMGDNYSRKLSYHAIHELSHRFAFDHPILACSMFAVSGEQSKDGHTYLGRNFDFEGGDIFDRHKVLTVARPTTGFAYVSVAWGGMSGVVSGMNEHGLAATLNAGASDGYQRVGTPTTMLVRRAMLGARTVDEAIKILTSTQRFVSDIISLADAQGNLAVVELGLRRHGVLRSKVIAATNHMRSETFLGDSVNHARQSQTTTLPRLAALEYHTKFASNIGLHETLQVLRSRRAGDGQTLPLGHRHAIDASIATHSVIFDTTSKRIYVSSGPHTLGAYYGYDIAKLITAKDKHTVVGAVTEVLPSSEHLPDYTELSLARHYWQRSHTHTQMGDADAAIKSAQKSVVWAPEHPESYRVLGIAYDVAGQYDNALRAYEMALRQRPEYPQQIPQIEARISELKIMEQETLVRPSKNR